MISDFYFMLEKSDCEEIENRIANIVDRSVSVEFRPELSDTDEFDNSIRISLPISDFSSIVNEESHAKKTLDLIFRYLLMRNAIQLNDTIFISNQIKVFFDRNCTYVSNNIMYLVADVVFEGYIEGVTNSPHYNQYIEG